MAGLPRVLLVEDDASVRRYVELALQDEPITFIACADVPAARAVLREAPVALLITDLMMPGENGLDLLRALHADPALRGGARLAVFSAGVHAAMRAELDALDVWRILPKPTSLAELLGCVTDARAAAPAAPAGTGSAAAPTSGSDAIATHFNGDAGLYHAFRAACVEQFGHDVVGGDDALAREDAGALRRLAHSLKTVLSTLGHAAPAADAARLEQACAAGDWATARPAWARLREALGALR